MVDGRARRCQSLSIIEGGKKRDRGGRASELRSKIHLIVRKLVKRGDLPLVAWRWDSTEPSEPPKRQAGEEDSTFTFCMW